ncbi:hypothetical protein BO70DRAFT_360030 [Aspergillus heteromorphus CBS 117.55]|uniref:Secreted protein n=1 Tax=Aspergillus heteromorphus CBS 117.55 TaxID=1448321 RepID=A0A317WNP1_9EURO|nr:uncharacterized protein BO70DRAFT_360030 [Aspergillus heteromorphus CBS 117.55]PWY87391.1 hypothetical protein BO70DRAFT_360030 [Aspergillus heteromorphus CBS 117.55]
MVNPRNIVCGIVACLLVDPCLAGNRDEPAAVSPNSVFAPAANVTDTIAAMEAAHASAYTVDNALEVFRTGLVALNPYGYMTGQVFLDLYGYVAGLISPKKPRRCTMIFDTLGDQEYHDGFRFQATIMYADCDKRESHDALLEQVAKCARAVKDAEANTGCCRSSVRNRWELKVQLQPARLGNNIKWGDC